jgi:DNA mismatch repair protein MSH3
VSQTQKLVRFHSPYIVGKLEQLGRWREELSIAAGEAWAAFLGRFGANYAVFRRFVGVVAQLDCLLSLAHLAQCDGYVKPTVSEAAQSCIHIADGRNPIIESLQQSGGYVPNDTALGGEARTLILTGPNMGGKSSYTVCVLYSVVCVCVVRRVGCVL